ncbi:hypothetical protein [Aestuariirhabdus litorea]|uniref:Uncharacterized protein n=1 Tax=Aestuariirhabdus litorea TaxID=2528527 RepID=A0A3P3VIV3_9GAMM|nr:hypothetical protein [Aestuariirhabdus litorea]RRJ82602.1 hypothetical protein D0544_12105 [Aestuariirhabdus litorea]RWW92761.1 hypothetical protein DZC74_12080 [Endozoicomonadaceae bacterium GTF-13]
MLHAIINNKAGRILVKEESIPLRQVYKEREDMITAAVFSRLPYLSEPTLQLLLETFLPDISTALSTLSGVEFWPRFSSTIQNQVEPDLILHFEGLKVVVEVKRPRDGLQHAEQWYRELEALPEDYWLGDLIFWAVGGDPSHNQELIAGLAVRLEEDEKISRSVPLFASDWISIAKGIDRLLRSDGPMTKADSVVLGDILSALELYAVQYREFKIADLCDSRLRGVAEAKCLAGWGLSMGDKKKPVVGSRADFKALPGLDDFEGLQRPIWGEWRKGIEQKRRSGEHFPGWDALQHYSPIADASFTAIKKMKSRSNGL